MSAGRSEPGRPTGRRRGISTTRDDILVAARSLFSQSGIDGTSVRAIATEAGVDSALIHHYFGTKRDLFVAAVALPMDPAIITDRIAATDVDALGPVIAATVIDLWDSEFQQAGLAVFRSVIAGPEPGLGRTLITDLLLRDLVDRIDDPAGSGPARVGLVASQIGGLILTRYIVGIDAMRTMPRDALVDTVGRTIQQYLTGPL